MSRYHSVLGVYYQQKSNYDEAKKQQLIALEIAEGINDLALQAKANQRLGVIYKFLGDFDVTMDYFFKSRDLSYQALLSAKKHYRKLNNIEKGKLLFYLAYISQVHSKRYDSAIKELTEDFMKVEATYKTFKNNYKSKAKDSGLSDAEIAAYKYGWDNEEDRKDWG